MDEKGDEEIAKNMIRERKVNQEILIGYLEYGF